MDAQQQFLTERAARHAPAFAVVAALVWLAVGDLGGAEPRLFGVVGLLFGLGALAAVWRGQLPALRSPAALGLGGLGLVALLSGGSVLWVDASPQLAWIETARAVTYLAVAVLAALTVVTAQTFARLVECVAGTCVAGAAWVAWQVLADQPLDAFTGGRLLEPLGYPNAVAAAAAVGVWLCVSLSVQAAWRHPANVHAGRSRAAGISAAWLAAAALLVLVGMLAQSRGAIVAGAAGGLALLVLVPARLQTALRLGVLGVVAWAAGERLGAPYAVLLRLANAREGGGGVPQAQEAAANSVRGAGQAIAFGVLSAALLGVALALVTFALTERRLRHVTQMQPPRGRGWTQRFPWMQRPPSAQQLPGQHLPGAQDRAAGRRQWAGPALAAGACVLVFVVLALDGRAPAWARGQIDGCRTPGAYNTTAPERSGSHLAEQGTNRCDFWRVGLDAWRERPFFGIGAGQYGARYALQRGSPELPAEPHSLPIQLLATLGIAGALGGLALVVALAWATLRYANSGPLRDPTFAGAIAAIVGWLVHAGLDVLWSIPVVTLAAVVLAGGLLGCVSPLRVRGHALRVRRGPGLRAAVALSALVLAAAVLPPTLADAFDARSRSTDRSPAEQLRDARRSGQLAPRWARPILRTGELARGQRRPDEVRRAAQRAQDREPGVWQTHVRAAELLRPRFPKLAAAADQRAVELNPQLRLPGDLLFAPDA